MFHVSKNQLLPDNLFTSATNFSKNKIFADPDVFHAEFAPADNLALPLVVDTEFVPADTAALKTSGAFTDEQPPCIGVTTQIKGIHQSDGIIFDHPDMHWFGDHLRHAPIKSAFHPIDYLNAMGIDASIRREELIHKPPKEGEPDDRLPTLTFVLYAHFALADLYKIVADAYLDDLAQLTFSKKIVMGRRMTTSGMLGFVACDWVVSLNGIDYRARIKIVDTAGLHGIASYKQIAQNVGFDLEAKGAMGEWITRMDEAYFAHPDFDRYALGDLHVYDLLVAYDKRLEEMHDQLGLSQYYSRENSLKLTIGTTAEKILLSKIGDVFGANPSTLTKRKDRADFLHGKTSDTTAAHLSTQIHNDVYLLSKCDGGRCHNANPLLVKMEGALFDTDIGGAYAATMSIQPYIFGTPAIEAPPKKPTMRNWIRANRRRLVPRTWFARFSTTAPLNWDQDLIASWYDFSRHIHKRQDSEGWKITGQVDLDSGEKKILAREIINGTLTSDVLDWIEHTCSDRQRKDFYDNCEINAWAIYPKNRRCKNRAEWEKKQSSHNHGAGKHYWWFSIDLGEMTVDQFRALRNKYPKGTPENLLNKLFCNVTYGDSVSRYFDTSNMIVAANITASVRCMVWYLEKALCLVQTITDGGAGDLNRVMYTHPDRKSIPTEHLTRVYATSAKEIAQQKICSFAPLGGLPISLAVENGEPVLIRGDQRLVGKAAIDWVDIEALKHTCELFPQAPILNAMYDRLIKRSDGVLEYKKSVGVFPLEMKRFFTRGAFHGSANYEFETLVPEGGDDRVVKMRSYESKKPHQAFTRVIVNGDAGIRWLDDYNGTSPAHEFLGRIIQDPTRVHRLAPFVKTGILKCGDFANRKGSTWEKSLMSPGDTIYRCGTPRLFSLAQFTFQTRGQARAWQRVSESLKRRYGESFEMFFQTEDGAINFQMMVLVIDRMIRHGCDAPLRIFDRESKLRNSVGIGIALNYKFGVDIMKERIREKISNPHWESDIPDYDPAEDYDYE